MTDDNQLTFDYTGRDYLALRDQLTAFMQARIPGWTPDASDFGYVLIEAMAYMGDMMSYYVDIAAQESNILSANSVANVYAYANLFGYQPSLAQSSSVDVVMQLTPNQVEDVLVQPGDRIYDAATGAIFELTENQTVPMMGAVTQPAWEGETRELTIGVSNGGAMQRMSIPLSSGKFIDGRPGTARVSVDSSFGTTSWALTYSLLDHGPNDYVFGIFTDAQGNASVGFGDGTSGAIPAAGSTIRLTFRECLGLVGNTVGSYAINQWLVTYSDLRSSKLSMITVSNPAQPSGGVDPESISSIREQVVKFAKAQRRAVTTEDFARIARSSSMIMTAWADARVWSRPLVWILPRDETILTEASTTRRSEIITDTTTNIAALAMVGTSPTVKFGTATNVSVALEVRVWDPIDLEAAANAVRSVILDKLSYNTSDFEREITEDYILRILRDNIDGNTMKFARVNSITADAREASDIGTYADLGAEYETTRALGLSPAPGCALRIRDEDLTIVVVGNGKIYRDTGA